MIAEAWSLPSKGSADFSFNHKRMRESKQMIPKSPSQEFWMFQALGLET